MSDNGENGPALPESNANSASVADLIEQEIAEGKLVLSEMESACWLPGGASSSRVSHC